MINLIPGEVLDTIAKVVDVFRSKIRDAVSSNLVFTLSDHISFAIDRFNSNIVIDAPLQYDIQHLYKFEYEMGIEALKIIKRDLNIKLPKSEASNIALHFINSKITSNFNVGYVERIINDIADIIGNHHKIYIDKTTFNYSRFVTHIQYLLKRRESGKVVSSENLKMFKSIKKEYNDTYKCVLKIKDYLEEELLYLILHVNRLGVREDCNRKSIPPTQKD